jgi:signal transduction histidine kinase
MTFQFFWQRLKAIFAPTPTVALLITLTLLASSIGLGIYNASLRQQEKIQRAIVQAKILANTMTGPMAFDDLAAVEEYLDALKADPDVDVAGIYSNDQQLVAGFSRPGHALPTKNVVGAPKLLNRNVAATARVAQGSTVLGSVYVEIAITPLLQRILRYLGIAMVIIMACMLVIMLAITNARLAEAYRRLQEETKERASAEEALRHAKKMESLGALTGGIAHDFNNLLMAASSALELMERSKDPAKIAQLKQGLRQTIERGAALTKQLLACARRTPLKPQVIDLVKHLQSMHTLLERSLRENISVEFHSDMALGYVELDPAQLELAILNIAINARDAMPNGGKIEVSLQNMPKQLPQDAEMVQLTISDNGTGIPPDVLPKVFEPFFTTKSMGRGTGMGLSQVYGFVHASGGQVTITSTQGRGTSVVILLPRSYKSLSVTATPTTLPTRAKTTKAVLRILIVEDDLSIAELLAKMLSELGHHSAHVTTADAALAFLRSNRVPMDLVLSDMVIPGMTDGLALALIITKEWPKLKIVLTTGSSGAAAAAAQHGFPVLLKPYLLQALDTELTNAMASDSK